MHLFGKKHCCPPTPQYNCCYPVQHKPNCKVVHKYVCEEVPEYCNFHTHVVTHKIKKPVYIPKYTCSNEIQEHNYKDNCCKY